jgi:uncharacterized membrane protein
VFLIERLKKAGRHHLTIFLCVMSLFCFGLSVTRVLLTGTKTFLFLNWNLFLAFIPWLLSSLIVVTKSTKKLFLSFLVISWLLFFPNAPYILTDLFHLKTHGSAPIWFDLIVVLSFAWTGLMYGFVSLMDIEKLLGQYFQMTLATVSSTVFLLGGLSEFI